MMRGVTWTERMIDAVSEWVLIGMAILMSPFWIPVALLGCAVQVLYYSTVLMMQMFRQGSEDRYHNNGKRITL